MMYRGVRLSGPRGVGPLLASCLLPLPAAAAQTAPGIEGLGRTLAALALILGLILGGGWLLKRLGAARPGAGGLVKVLGGASLGGRERVVVVEVEGERLVLGVSPGRVQALHVLKSGDFAARLEREQGR